jgi:OOP family OmpA-OmpF porin
MGIGKKALLAGLVAGTSALIAPAALAQPQMPGWYVGGSLGQSEFKDCGLPGCDDKDTAWRIFGGYEINRNFAVELGYTDLGEVSAPGASAEATAWELVGVGSFPVADRFSIYGKLGGYRADTEARIGGLSRDESNTGITYGVGAQYDFTRTVGVRAEWQRYADVGDDNVGGEGDVDVLSVGVRVKF